MPTYQESCYQPVKDFKNWPVVGSFNNQNIIYFAHKSTSSEDLDKIHQVVLYIISENGCIGEKGERMEAQKVEILIKAQIRVAGEEQ